MSMQPFGDVIAAIEAHRAECDVTKPCNRCSRYKCRCGALFSDWDDANSKPHERCADCRAKAQHDAAVGAFVETIPKRFRWALGGDAAQLVARVKAKPELVTRALANPPATDFLLQGDTGAGKTSLAVAMLHALVTGDHRRWKGTRFAAAYWLAGARARAPLGQGEAPEVLQAMRAPLLLLDDVGSEASDRRNVVEDVIFQRHNDELPTWITTGFSEQQLVERYGSQVARRPIETGKRVQLGVKA